MGRWLRPQAPNSGGPGSNPGRGTRSHMLQLKIMQVATETCWSQINIYIYIYIFKSFLIIALFLVQVLYLNYLSQFRKKSQFSLSQLGLDCLQLRTTHLPKSHISGRAILLGGYSHPHLTFLAQSSLNPCSCLDHRGDRSIFGYIFSLSPVPGPRASKIPDNSWTMGNNSASGIHMSTPSWTSLPPPTPSHLSRFS